MNLDLHAVLSPSGLTEGQISQLASLLASLEGDEHAPTAVRESDLAAYVHLADSLAALEVEDVRSARDVADLGAGAGFPGLALAVALPEAIVALVESQRRKCEFVSRTVAAAGISNARIVCARAEDWPEGVGSSDVVTARALAGQPVVLEYAAPLLRLGGVLVDWRGRRDAEEELAADRAAGELGMRREDVRRVVPFPNARDRHLHIFRKVAETPDRFPRRAGVARKRPLGA
jgi:16S rRNA (guanine527-N7)-methyltransferase